MKKVLGGVLDDCGLDLMSKMLEMDPVKRISAKDCLDHEYSSKRSTTKL